MGARHPPLVGRRDLVRDLGRRLDSGESLVIAGPPGIGKTRLAHEVCERAVRTGAAVERVLATAETSQHPLGTLAALGVLAEGDDPVQALAGALRRWAARSRGEAPFVVWLDDAHHADPLTAAITRHAVATGVVRLVATQRDSDPLPRDLESLVTEALAERRFPAPLDRSSVRRLARACAAPRVLSREQVETIEELSTGNPLFVRELARAAAAGVADLHHSPSVELLVGRAVHDLDPEARRVLEAVAVAEPVPLALFDEDAEAVARLRSVGLVVLHGDEMIRTDHPLRRAWLLREIGPRRPAVVGGLLDRLSGAAGREVDVLTFVGWSETAGRPVDGETLERAARVALRRGDLPRFDRLVARLPDDVASLLRVHARIGLGDVTDVPGDLDDLIRHGSLRVRAEAVHLLVRHEGISRGRVDRAEEALTDLERRGGELHRDQVWASRLWLWTFRGLPTGADAALDGVLQRVRALPPGADRAGLSAALLSIVLNARGPTDAEEVFEWTDDPTGYGSTSGTGPAHVGVARTWQRIGALRGGDGRREAVRSLDVVRPSHDLESYALVAGSAGWALALCGDVGRAARVSEPEAAEASSAWFRFPDMRRVVHLGNLCYLGEGDAASASLAEVRLDEALGGPYPLPLLVARAHALVAGAVGEAPEPDVLIHALEVAARGRKHAFAAFLALECTDLGDPPEVHRTVERAVEGARGGVLDLTRRAAVARRDGDPGALLEVVLDLERAGLVTPALRVAGDVSRADGPDGPDGFAARAALVRLLDGWDAVDPWWVDDLPTGRQREVADLVRQGRTPAQVADELVLSRRTVENHLQRVYEYLGVHSRPELVDALTPPSRP
jgi:hypothetical protein